MKIGILEIIFHKKQQEQRGVFSQSLQYNCSNSYTASRAMMLSTVYRCVDIISDSVAQLPIDLFKVNDGKKVRFVQHPSYYMLSKEPNPKMSRFTFIKTLIVSALLKGNGYAIIERDEKGNAVSMEYIPSEKVSVQEKDGEIRYLVQGLVGYVESCNMIHVLNFSYDGIHGISTLEHAKMTLGLSLDSENHAAGFFKGGANAAGVLKVQSTLSKEQKEQIRQSWGQTFNATGGNPNGVAVLEGNMDFQPITINPSDAQLLETRQFNVIDICRFFGVSPVKAFDLTKSSYSTVEATQLAFLTDTLSPLLEKIESEFERKLFRPSERKHLDIKFDTSVLLRADKASLAEYYNKLFQMGVVSINEVRCALDLKPIENGDHSFVQVNVQTLDNAVKKQELNNIDNGTKS